VLLLGFITVANLTQKNISVPPACRKNRSSDKLWGEKPLTALLPCSTLKDSKIAHGSAHELNIVLTTYSDNAAPAAVAAAAEETSQSNITTSIDPSLSFVTTTLFVSSNLGQDKRL
jgi:hypothetical protein